MSTSMTSKFRIKTWVSKQKRRFQEDGFDLDLSYIAHNVIAMGFPGERIEGIYRNNLDDVYKFLELRHCGKYKIYNLCACKERSYNPQKFKGRVAHFPFEDHNPPSLSIIPKFCSDVQNWLSQPDNVAVVHCKAGKGRTGVMICCYLLHSKMVSTAAEALKLYARERTHNGKGVTIPSQQRYVKYYEHILTSPDLQYVNRTVFIREITLEGLIGKNITFNTIYVYVTQAGAEDLTYSCGGIEWKKSGSGAPFTIAFEQPLALRGDINIELCVKNILPKHRLCHFWFNTFFIDKDLEQNNSLGESSTTLTSNRTVARFTVYATQPVRNNSDTLRELDRTNSCPTPVDLHRPPLPEQWTRSDDCPFLVDARYGETELPPKPVPMMFLSFPRSNLDVPKHTFGDESSFKVTVGFSQHETETGNHLTTASPRCYRSNSDSTQQPHQHPRYSSSSSSSSSCTDDETSSHSSEGSGDSEAVGGGRKHYKF